MNSPHVPRGIETARRIPSRRNLNRNRALACRFENCLRFNNQMCPDAAPPLTPKPTFQKASNVREQTSAATKGLRRARSTFQNHKVLEGTSGRRECRVDVRLAGRGDLNRQACRPDPGETTRGSLSANLSALVSGWLLASGKPPTIRRHAWVRNDFRRAQGSDDQLRLRPS